MNYYLITYFVSVKALHASVDELLSDNLLGVN